MKLPSFPPPAPAAAPSKPTGTPTLIADAIWGGSRWVFVLFTGENGKVSGQLEVVGKREEAEHAVRLARELSREGSVLKIIPHDFGQEIAKILGIPESEEDKNRQARVLDKLLMQDRLSSTAFISYLKGERDFPQGIFFKRW